MLPGIPLPVVIGLRFEVIESAVAVKLPELIFIKFRILNRVRLQAQLSAVKKDSHVIEQAGPDAFLPVIGLYVKPLDQNMSGAGGRLFDGMSVPGLASVGVDGVEVVLARADRVVVERKPSRAGMLSHDYFSRPALDRDAARHRPGSVFRNFETLFLRFGGSHHGDQRA
jgi:hypothetical protein